jgi:predicted PurR-regulated permease PerM
MTGRDAPVPPWARVLLVLASLAVLWVVGRTIGHALLIFTVSVVVALLLNPLVRMLTRLRIPRGLAVLTVFAGFIGAVVLGVMLVISPVRTQVEEIRQNLPVYTDQAQRQVDSLQAFFDRKGIGIDVSERSDEAIDAVRERVDEVADDLVSYSLDVLGALVTLIIILVASIYMLLDAPRIARFAERLGGREASAFLRRTEHTLTEYLKAQLLVALIIGTSAGVVLWIYGVTGVFSYGATFAVAFAAWVFVMEFVPYVGPILGAVPPTLLALLTSPITALWVVLAFIGIHQLEGHVVVPKLMGGAVGVHPLVVIFGLLIGEELAGLVGILLAIPVVVIVKETVVFVLERMSGRRAAGEEVPADGEPTLDAELAVHPDPSGAPTAAPPAREPPAGPTHPARAGLRPDS